MRALLLVGLAVVLAGTGGRASVQVTATTTAQGSAFTPKSITVAVGDTVNWVNEGGVHSVRFDDGSYDSGDPTGNTTIGSRTFDAVGSFRYFCELHGAAGGIGMSGRVVVADPSATPTPTPTSTATATVTPSVTPTATPGGRIESLAVRKRVRRGKVRGSARVTPTGVPITVEVMRAGLKVAAAELPAEQGVTSFAARLSRPARKRLARKGALKVVVRLSAGGAAASRKVRLRPGAPAGAIAPRAGSPSWPS
jgi:plastocyanin